MRRLAFLLLAGVLLLAGMANPVPAFAADPFEQVCDLGGGGSPACNADGAKDPIHGTIVSITSILAVVAGIVSVISLIWGGIKYITSSGEPKAVAAAKQAAVAALIGLLIAVLARPMVLFVLGKVG